MSAGVGSSLPLRSSGSLSFSSREGPPTSLDRSPSQSSQSRLIVHGTWVTRKSPSASLSTNPEGRESPVSFLPSPPTKRRVRALSMESGGRLPPSPKCGSGRKLLDLAAKEQSRNAQRVNDSMVYLEGPQIYACAQCRTHLTSHDDIISKSFHGRHGRAYLFDQCVNVKVGPAEDRLLITGLHSVCDIFCKRCNHLVGWTYKRAYEASQKYKEGKYIIEKINLHMEESGAYSIHPPAGEKRDRWRARSISWGSESSLNSRSESPMVFEYTSAGAQDTSNALREAPSAS